jgi:hypothetical protein
VPRNSSFGGFLGYTRSRSLQRHALHKEQILVRSDSYTLMRGDTRLGELREYEIDQPWIRCRFVAESAFAEIRPLFEAEIQALQTEPGNEDVLDNTFEAIQALNLHLVGNDEKYIGSMILHIHDNDAWFRY